MFEVVIVCNTPLADMLLIYLSGVNVKCQFRIGQCCGILSKNHFKGHHINVQGSTL